MPSDPKEALERLTQDAPDRWTRLTERAEAAEAKVSALGDLLSSSWIKADDRCCQALDIIEDHALLDPTAPAEEERAVKRTMTINLTDEEMAALDKLAAEKDLKPPLIFRQALRVYQLYCLPEGHPERISRSPSYGADRMAVSVEEDDPTFWQPRTTAFSTAPVQDVAGLRPDDLNWLRQAKDVGHCGEGLTESKGRAEHNARIDRILAALLPVPPSHGSETAQRELDREDEAHGRTIDERDEAEEALSQAYYSVTGKFPSWSNLFGPADALEEIGETIAAVKLAAQPHPNVSVLVEAAGELWASVRLPPGRTRSKWVMIPVTALAKLNNALSAFQSSQEEG